MHFGKKQSAASAKPSPILPNEPIWLPLDEVISLNQRIVELTNEPYFLRDLGLLDSALHKAKNRWYYGEMDIAVLATSLLLGIAGNHPFEQGNKRTGFVASIMFLRANNYDFVAPDSDIVGEFIWRGVIGDIPEHRFLTAYRKCVVRDTTD